jgi:hypothetical protein
LPDDDHLVAKLESHEFLILSTVPQLKGHLHNSPLD